MYRIRPLALPEDYPHLAALFSCDSPEPVTVADLEEGDSKIPEPGAVGFDGQGRLTSHCRDRYVAVDEQGLVVGYGDAWRAPWNPPGEMICYVIVDPALRGRGIGRLLLDRVERTAREKSATYIKAQLKDSDPPALAWVERRGYVVDRHLFSPSSTWPLATRPRCGAPWREFASSPWPMSRARQRSGSCMSWRL